VLDFLAANVDLSYARRLPAEPPPVLPH